MSSSFALSRVHGDGVPILRRSFLAAHDALGCRPTDRSISLSAEITWRSPRTRAGVIASYSSSPRSTHRCVLGLMIALCVRSSAAIDLPTPRRVRAQSPSSDRASWRRIRMIRHRWRCLTADHDRHPQAQPRCRNNGRYLSALIPSPGLFLVWNYLPPFHHSP